jgi:hypothetical protein
MWIKLSSQCVPQQQPQRRGRPRRRLLLPLKLLLLTAMLLPCRTALSRKESCSFYTQLSFFLLVAWSESLRQQLMVSVATFNTTKEEEEEEEESSSSAVVHMATVAPLKDSTTAKLSTGYAFTAGLSPSKPTL